MSNLTVRDFKDQDAISFLGMGEYLQKGGNYKHCGFDPVRVMALFAQIMKNPEYFGVIAESEDGKPVGCFVANLQPYYFSDKKIAFDLCFGILPDYRDSAAATIATMLEKYEAWAKEMGAVEATVSTSAGMHGDKLEGYLNGVGYNTVGFTTKKRIG